MHKSKLKAFSLNTPTHMPITMDNQHCSGWTSQCNKMRKKIEKLKGFGRKKQHFLYSCGKTALSMSDRKPKNLQKIY